MGRTRAAEDLPQIARNLRSLRERERLTQEQLAERLGVKQSQYSKWETGRDRPRAAAIAGLALALKASADDVLKGLALVVNGKVRMARDKRAPPEPAPAKGRRASSRTA